MDMYSYSFAMKAQASADLAHKRISDVERAALHLVIAINKIKSAIEEIPKEITGYVVASNLMTANEELIKAVNILAPDEDAGDNS